MIEKPMETRLSQREQENMKGNLKKTGKQFEKSMKITEIAFIENNERFKNCHLSPIARKIEETP